MKIYWGTNLTDNENKAIIRAELHELQVKDFKDVYDKFFKIPQKGNKHDVYITIAKQVETTRGDIGSRIPYHQYDHFHRNDRSQLTAQFIAYDGDASKSNHDSCISYDEIHRALIKLNYNFILYTTHSHSATKNRWRVIIPCLLNHKDKLQSTMYRLFQELEALCPDLKWSNESKTWSQPWYIALRDSLDDGLFRSNFYDQGKDFLAVEVPFNATKTAMETLPSTSEIEMIKVLMSGNHPLHETMNKYIYGRVKDGMQPGAIKSHLHAFSLTWDLSDQRLQSRKNDIDRLVDQASIKFANDSSSHWSVEQSDTDRIFTKYPDLGGKMEVFVQECMSWMIFPNRQIAVTAIRGLISAMGSRTYTLQDGKGINLTALITGRSTIGKSNIKKFFIWALDNISINKLSQLYLGAQHYTSPKNLVDDLREKIALYSVRTESGQSDKSSAGDMSRVMSYELEFATEGGSSGYVSRGGQNKTRSGDETLPALYSPPVTTVRESVAQIQNDADVLNQSTVAGVTGRRSVILIDPIKAARNYNRPEKPSKNLKELIISLHKLASDTIKIDCTIPMPMSAWIIVKSEDPNYLKARENDWLVQENKAAANGENLSSTFFGRLYERVPAFASILAIAENPLMPVITNAQYKVAEQCLFNEFQALNEQNSDGSLNGYWGVLEQKIINIFKGDMTKYVTRYPKSLQEIAKIELKDGAIEQAVMFRILQHIESFITAKAQKGFMKELEDRCLALNIRKLKETEVKEKYKHKRAMFGRA